MLNKIFSWFEKRINPYPDLEAEIPTKGLIPFIYFSITGIKKWLFVLVILGFIIGVFEAFLFQVMGWVVDFLSQETPETLWANRKSALILIVVVLLISPLITLLKGLVQFQTINGVFPMRLRWWFHHLVLGQSMKFFQDEFAGRVSAKVMQTALAVRQVVLAIADIAVYICVYLLTSAVILFSFDWRLLLPFLVWIILVACIMKVIVPKISKITERQADARALMTGRVTDTYSNIQTVKLFAQSKNEYFYTKEAMDEFLQTVHAQMRLINILDILLYSINMLLILTTGLLGVWLWSYGLITVGAIAASTALALRLNSMAFWIMWEMAILFENIGVVKDGINTFSIKPEVVDIPDAKPLIVTKGEIQFKNVTYGYQEDKLLFQNFNLTVSSGEKIGLVGPSGAGKSTLINLLLRFYDLNSGQILIDNQDISQVTQESLRAQIGMVTQDTSLLHRSIKENIKYGKADTSDDEIIFAAKEAQAHDFILQLADNYGHTDYDTLVGERGVKLSGGQRQRISIARVMLKNAPILLLDEATSALDSEIEAVIQETLYQLMENKTVIAIAHRLSTIAAMDRLVVMDQGKIVEMGTHQELIAQNGLYAKLWQRQSGGFLDVD